MIRTKTREHILNNPKKLITLLVLFLLLTAITTNNIGNMVSVSCSNLKMESKFKTVSTVQTKNTIGNLNKSYTNEIINLEPENIPSSNVNADLITAVSSTNTSTSVDDKTSIDTNTKTIINSAQNTSTMDNKEVAENTASTKLCDIFKNDLFLGDSITKGLSSYKVLNDANVCAKVGNTINQVRDMVNSSAITNPKRIFILCGVNNVDKTPNREMFSNNYLQLIHTVKAKFPQSTIYVQSILPILPIAEQNTPYLNNSCIDAYNKIIMNIAESENLTYINLASILNASNKNLYEGDGLHYKSGFYPLWLNYLKDNYK